MSVGHTNTDTDETLQDRKILILLPVYNDWEALTLLLERLDAELLSHVTKAEVLIVDDASEVPFNQRLPPLRGISRVDVLELRRNLGHQRAIAIGLAYIEAHRPCEAVVVMDADGEDSPSDVPKLIDKCAEYAFGKLIFARRVKRSEGALFTFFYLLYKMAYKILTGQNIRMGNFSIIPFGVLRSLVAVSEIWNHYAVGAIKGKVPYAEILTRREKRLAGRSKMNFVSLVIHGLAAISVHGEVVGVRALIATSVLILLSLAALAVVVAIRLFTTLAIPGWATYAGAALIIILIQGVSVSLFFVFIILSSRNNYDFLPMRDFSNFVLNAKTIHHE